MSEVKFEPLLGDQSVFHKDDKESVVVIGYSLGRSIIKGFSDKYLSTLNQGEQIIAMRRIIKTPVWTNEDIEAKRLPAVGCEIFSSATGRSTVLFNDGVYIIAHSHEGCVGKYNRSEVFSYFTYIETPEERAKRVREEWINHAYEKLISADVKGKASLGDIYDALLSGELKAPGVE